MRFVVVCITDKGKEMFASFTTKGLADAYARATKARWPRWHITIEAA